MGTLVEFTAEMVRAARRAYAKKGTFLVFFALVFWVMVSFLGWLDLLPNGVALTSPRSWFALSAEELKKSSASALVATTTLAPEVVEDPIRIEANTIGLNALITNAATTNVEALDRLLLQGAVRYPTSARLGEEGNLVLFGHSSYLPVVGNQAYKAFNDIQKLKAGDTVTLYSSGTAYTYAVRSVTRENAENNSAIALGVSGRVLTLVTCNSFGKKSDRFVVTAELVESHSIGA